MDREKPLQLLALSRRYPGKSFGTDKVSSTVAFAITLVKTEWGRPMQLQHLFTLLVLVQSNFITMCLELEHHCSALYVASSKSRQILKQ